MLVINKIDVCRLSDLPPSSRELVDEIIKTENVHLVEVSCYSDEGVTELKTKACDALLAQRVETKMKGNKINSVINRIHVAQPKPRDDIERAPFIPEAVLERKKFDKNDPERKRLERDLEAEDGGAGVYSIDMRSAYYVVLLGIISHTILQRTTCLRSMSGSTTLCRRFGRARMSRTSSTPI